MTFFWPYAFALFVLVPVVVLVHRLLQGRRARTVSRYSSLVLAAAGAGTSRWRRRLPPALYLLALVLAIVATARPAAVVTLPSQREIVMLAMDVSGSMKATDVAPNRLAAAQAAARTFIADLPANTRVGVVSFAASATVVQSPTERREDVLAAIDRFQLQKGTAVGSAILVSLKTIFPDVKFDLQSANPRGENARRTPRGTPLDVPAEPGKDDKDAAEKTVPPGSYNGAAIVLLTDGQATAGPDPIESARMAAERGVRVFTIGIGTKAGETLRSEGWSMRVRLDEEALKNIANITRGDYFFAASTEDLKKIYQSLNTRFFMEKKETEISALFAGAAALVALLAGALSLLWFNRIL